MRGICSLSIIPCRAEPSDKAEIVTQLLFGETFSVIDKQEKWMKISIAHDGYECWIDKKQFFEISEEEFNELNTTPPLRTIDLLMAVKDKQQGGYHNLCMGSVLPHYKGNDFYFNDHSFIFKGNTAEPTTENLVLYANLYLNAPYLWGGRTPFGIDCSGFTQMVFALCGVLLPRDAYQQAELGSNIPTVAEAKEKDLAFFNNPEGRITHVGIVLDDSKIIHASGKVRIDKLDDKGIWNEDTQSYSHVFHSIKRL